MDDLQSRLTRLAEACPPPLDPVARAVRNARTVHRRRTVVTAALAVFAVAGGGAGIALSCALSAAPAGGAASYSYAAWAPRGNLAGDDALLTTATRVWDAATGTRHHGVHVLYAGDNAAGDYAIPRQLLAVVLLGLTADGRQRIGWFTGPQARNGQDFALAERADTAAPDTAGRTYLGWVVAQQGTPSPGTPTAAPGGIAVVLAAPGYTVAPVQLGLSVPPNFRWPEGVCVIIDIGSQQAGVSVLKNGHSIGFHEIGPPA